MNMNGAEKICSLCNERRREGVGLLQGFICDGCLQQVSQVRVGDPDYLVIVEKLKKLWQAG